MLVSFSIELLKILVVNQAPCMWHTKYAKEQDDKFYCNTSWSSFTDHRNWIDIQSYADQVKRKVNCSELSVEKTLLGLPHIVKAASETWPNPRVKLNFTLAWSFQQEPCCEMDVMPNVNFALCSNSKNELGDFYNYLSQQVITAINTWNDSVLGHQVDYMFSQRSFQLKLLKITKIE